MDLTQLVATLLIFVAAGFATTVWALLAWSSRRHFWRFIAYTVVGNATAVITGVVFVALVALSRSRPPLDLHPLFAPAVLVPTFVIPAMLQLQSWMTAKRIVSDHVVAEVDDAGRLTPTVPELEVSAVPDPQKVVTELVVTVEPDDVHE